MFNPDRLELARKRSRKTSRILAEETGIQPVAISRILNGTSEPTEDQIRKFAVALNYPVSFFMRGDVDVIDTEAASFRSLTSMTARERDASLAAGSLAFEVSDWVHSAFKLPEPDVIDISYERNPANAARVLRAHWGIGERPIGNLIHFLETKGIRIFSLDENTKKVDAFSCWRNNEPFIFLNTFKTAERSRFDAAHELGHLVLHRHGGPNQRDAEFEANTFASSFLMPHADVISHINYINSLSDIIRHKKRWRVSAAALAYRLHKMGIISEWNYRTFNIQLRQNYSESEPEGIERERSHIWLSVLQELWKDGKTVDHIASSLHLPSSEVGAILFGLTSNLHRLDLTPAVGGLRVVK